MTQFTLEQLRRFGIRPDTRLGQHFLVDDNVLQVIDRLSNLGPDDIVYEPGIGVGVLTAYLADRVAHVHGIELDRRLEPAVDALLEGRTNVSVQWCDAMDVTPGQLQPGPPTKLISNLPYHVAAPIVAEALQHTPSMHTFCVMIQKEVAERFFSPHGGSSYGAISVLVQALTQRTGTHQVSRNVFAPPPNVDSTLLAFRRRDDPGVEAIRVADFAAFVKVAFGQRRKTLANNLQQAVGGREPVVTALADFDMKPAARPQELTPPQFVELFRRLGEPAP